MTEIILMFSPTPVSEHSFKPVYSVLSELLWHRLTETYRSFNWRRYLMHSLLTADRLIGLMHSLVWNPVQH